MQKHERLIVYALVLILAGVLVWPWLSAGRPPDSLAASPYRIPTGGSVEVKAELVRYTTRAGLHELPVYADTAVGLRDGRTGDVTVVGAVTAGVSGLAGRLVEYDVTEQKDKAVCPLTPSLRGERFTVALPNAEMLPGKTYRVLLTTQPGGGEYALVLNVSNMTRKKQ